MATLSAASRQVKEQLDQCLPQECIYKICAQIAHRWRRRILDPAQNVQLLLLQLLTNVALRGLRRVADVSISAQAICAARMRLPVKLFARLVQCTVPENLPGAAYKQFKIYIVDGMSFMTADAPPVVLGCGAPLPKLEVNPRRARRTQPRRLKNARHRFPQLNQPRVELCKPPCVAKI